MRRTVEPSKYHWWSSRVIELSLLVYLSYRTSLLT